MEKLYTCVVDIEMQQPPDKAPTEQEKRAEEKRQVRAEIKKLNDVCGYLLVWNLIITVLIVLILLFK